MASAALPSTLKTSRGAARQAFLLIRHSRPFCRPPLTCPAHPPDPQGCRLPHAPAAGSAAQAARLIARAPMDSSQAAAEGPRSSAPACMHRHTIPCPNYRTQCCIVFAARNSATTKRGILNAFKSPVSIAVRGTAVTWAFGPFHAPRLIALHGLNQCHRIRCSIAARGPDLHSWLDAAGGEYRQVWVRLRRKARSSMGRGMAGSWLCHHVSAKLVKLQGGQRHSVPGSYTCTALTTSWSAAKDTRGRPVSAAYIHT